MAQAPQHRTVAETGVPLERDVKLKIEWPKFAANLIKTVVAGFAAAHGGIEHVGEALAGLLEASGSISVDASAGERGWTLFALAFAWSFDELRARGSLDEAGLEPAVRDALEEARRLVDRGDQTVPVSFLEQPTTLPLYKVVRDVFVARKAAFRPAGGEADDALSARFDAAFNRAIFLLWSQAPEQYQPLAAALSAPGAAAHAFQLEWDSYRRGLIHDFEVRPVFGQETTRVSLSQLYVPLRGVWSEDAEPAPPKKQAGYAGKWAEAKAVARQPLTQIVQLDDELVEWAISGPEKYELKLVGGSPGSGKSTTAKALACRLAARPDCRPLLVPLSHIDLASDLRETVNLFFTRRTDSPFRQPPLSRRAVEEGPPLVLIFDGLDELARPGEAANEVTRDFMVKLGQLTSELWGEGKRRLRAIVFGRLLSFQAAQRYAGAARRRSYEVVGYTSKSRFVVVQWPNAENQALADLDQRVVWWQRYAAATGAQPDLPEALTAPALEELTSEPLLCYLLALSGYLTQDAELAAGNINVVYHELIDEVWRRGWGEGEGADRREGPGKYLDQAGFNRLMETIALAGWQGGDTRICSEASFLAATRSLRTQREWDAFVRDNGPDMTTLAMNFYLRSAEGDARGFEFTHKSFGEHLAARAILALAFDRAALVERRIEIALKEWFDVTASGTMTNEIMRYMVRELRLRMDTPESAAEVTGLQEAFQCIAAAVLQDGLPANGNAEQPWRVAEARQRNAEVTVWAVLHACASARSASGGKSVRIEIKWPDASAFGDLLRRLTRQSRVRERLLSLSSGTYVFSTMRFFAYIDAEGADLTGQTLMGVDLQHANLRGASLVHASMICCDMGEADLSDAKLNWASIYGCSFDGTVLKGAKLFGARLTSSSLHNADVTDVDLTDATIQEGTPSGNRIRNQLLELARKRESIV